MVTWTHLRIASVTVAVAAQIDAKVDQSSQSQKDIVHAITVEVSRRPLHDREREVLLDDLDRRGIAPAIRDVLPPNGRFFRGDRKTSSPNYPHPMRRISNSIALAKESWKVLQADKELLILPVISGIASIIVAATFAVPLFLTSSGDEAGILTYIVLFIMYVVLAYVTIFFNAALVSAAHERLNGGDPTLRTALAGAASRAGKILPWAIVSATVSTILRAIEERAGFVGQLVAGLAGMAWAVVTFLVLPIIVIEGIGVSDAIKKSGRLFKQTWGENLAAQVGFGLLGFLAVLPGIAIVVLAALSGNGGVLGGGIVVGVVWIILVAVVIAALSVIFQTALYHFAVDGTVPAGAFSQATMAAAFAPKPGKASGPAGFTGGGFGGWRARHRGRPHHPPRASASWWHSSNRPATPATPEARSTSAAST